MFHSVQGNVAGSLTYVVGNYGGQEHDQNLFNQGYKQIL